MPPSVRRLTIHLGTCLDERASCAVKDSNYAMIIARKNQELFDDLNSKITKQAWVSLLLQAKRRFESPCRGIGCVGDRESKGGGLSTLDRDGRAVGTSQLAWDKIEQLARDYVAKKHAPGRYDRVEHMASPKPTWNMLEGKEDVPETSGVFGRVSVRTLPVRIM
jgi:hypothetical protein